MKHLLNSFKRFIGLKNKPEQKIKEMDWQTACKKSKNHLAILRLNDRSYLRDIDCKTWQKRNGKGMWNLVPSYLAHGYNTWEPAWPI